MKRIAALFSLLLLTGCMVQVYRVIKNPEAGMNPDKTRFLVKATINDKPALLALDTGLESNVALFTDAAERLGLTFNTPPMSLGRPDGQMLSLSTKPYRITAFSVSGRMCLTVVNIPIKADIDGSFGWPLFRDNVMQIDVSKGVLRIIPSVPREARTWTKFGVLPKSSMLFLTIPGPHGNGVILVDTGSSEGVALNPERWRVWTNANPDRPKTITGFYSPGSGSIVSEESWAQHLSLGPLTFTGVPVIQLARNESASMPPGFIASLGIAALERLDIIVDGKENAAYIRSREAPPLPHAYNRAGVTFFWGDPHGGSTNNWIAYVVQDTPAYEAGIRNGDVLIQAKRISGVNSPMDVSSNFPMLPAGTRIDLTLKHEEKTYNTTVTLRDIFPTAASPSANEPATAASSK